MAWSLRTLVSIVAVGALAACAHAPGAGSSLASSATGPLPELGEDLPTGSASTTTPARVLSVDMPVGELCGHPDARAVVDRDLPGLTGRPEYVFFRRMTLRQLQVASNGRMTPAELARISSDLEALGSARRRRPWSR